MYKGDIMTVLSRLQTLCDARDISITALCLAATGNKGNLNTWKKNNGNMRSDYLSKCADILGVSTDFLLGRYENKSSRETEVKVKFSGAFDFKDIETKYSFYIWEACQEVYLVNTLFRDLITIKPFERTYDWWIVFKYNIIVLCEAAKLLVLNEESNVFGNVLNTLINNNSSIKNSYDSFISFWTDNNQFFRTVRNNICHFEHEKNDNDKLYMEALEKIDTYCFIDDGYMLTDRSNPIFLKVMSEIYDKYNHDSTETYNDKMEPIIKLYNKLCTYTLDILTQISHIYLRDIEAKGNVSINKKDGHLKYESVFIKNEYSGSVNNSSGNIVALGKNNKTGDIYNGTEQPLSAQEKDLLEIYRNADGRTQLKLMNFAYGIEAEKNN